MRRRIPREMLRPGLCLPGDLFDADGRLIFRSGARLTRVDISRIRRQSGSGVFGGSDWPELSSGGSSPSRATEADVTSISVDALRDGMKLTEDIYDQSDVLLVAAGTKITTRFLELLKRRNIKSVKLRSAAVERKPDAPSEPSHREKSEQLDEAIADELGVRKKSVIRRDRPAPVPGRPRLPLEDLRAEASRGLETHIAASKVVVDVCNTIGSGAKTSGKVIAGAIEEFVEITTLDMDLLPLILSMQRSEHEYLFDHCVNVTLVSMSMAAQLGWGKDKILELGYGALLQDVGMLRVPETIRLGGRSITAAERGEIERHPYHTLDYLDKVAGLPETARFVAYQSHERCDKTGYPSKRSGMFQHPYAKIVAIADAYSAMTRDRPHRRAHAPYEAAKIILMEGAADKFDRKFVRTFLDVVSLFPIGSYVELSDGTHAQVIRANPGVQTNPIVEVVDDDRKLTGQLIDLARVPDLSVAHTLAPAVQSKPAVPVLSQ
jgi:HD-GYP domain-containing protein (c-di-GMP phosphodiesterase class II)